MNVPAVYTDFRDAIPFKVAQSLKNDGYEIAVGILRVEEDLEEAFRSHTARNGFGIASTDERLMKPRVRGFLGWTKEDARRRVLAKIHFNNEIVGATPDQWVVLMYGEDTMGLVQYAVSRAHLAIDPAGIKPPVFYLSSDEPKYECFGLSGLLNRRNGW